MPLSDFEEILQWAASNQIMRISLCGGEPTLHSHFDKILSLITNYGFKTYFASNFTIDCTSWQNFNAKVIDKIFIHLADKTIENLELKNCLYKNISHAKKQGIALIYRTNIANKTPEIDEWFRIIEETDLHQLNIALTFPDRQLKNQFIDLSIFEEYAEVLWKIIDKSDKSNIILSFAKPTPLCIFNEQMQRYLLSRLDFHPTCGVHYQNHTNNVCISTDMNIHPCLGVTAKSLKFRKNISWQEVENLCIQTLKPLINRPLFDKCHECFLFDRKLCQGSCLSYKIKT
jgi:organic radical activating enzyme